MTGKRAHSRKRISETWQPTEAGREYATERGINIDEEVEGFRDYHLAHGSLMADWDAAWRTWCRHCVTYGRASGKPPTPGLILAFNSSDPFGIDAWRATLPDTRMEHDTGLLVQALCGYPIHGVAMDICQAAGFNESDRPDLEIIAQWIRDGYDPDSVIEIIKHHRKPERPVLRYFDNRVREKARKAA